MAALQRMYRDIQEPMLDAATQQLGGQNPFAALVENADTPGGECLRNSSLIRSCSYWYSFLRIDKRKRRSRKS